MTAPSFQENYALARRHIGQFVKFCNTRFKLKKKYKRVRRYLRQREPVDYDATRRQVAESIVRATEVVGNGLATFLWSLLAAAICGAIFGSAGFALGFFGVWFGVMAPRLGNLLLTLGCSAIPAALIGGVLCLLFGGAFVGFWLLATLGVAAVVWAETVTEPVPLPPEPLPQMHGTARPAGPDELDDLEYLE